MRNFKYIIVLVSGLISAVSYAGLLVDNNLLNETLTLDGNDQVNISVEFEEPVEGDLYVAAQLGNDLWFLNADEKWVSLQNDEDVVLFKSNIFEDKLDLFSINVKGLNAGKYTVYQVVTSAGDNPFDKEDWLPTRDSLNKLDININLNPKSPEEEIVPDTTTPNTDIPNIYFRSTLPKRALGDKYTGVVSSEEKWNAIVGSDASEESKQKQKETLYWDGDFLIGWDDDAVNNNNRVIIDSLRENSFKQSVETDVKITIAEPLTSIHITGYPGCAGIADLGTHPRACGEASNEVFTKSEVFSQRWSRPYNLDVEHDPVYAGVKKEDIKYDLLASVYTVNIMKHDDLKKTPLMFEMTVSGVPGDFSENACKPVGALQYHNAIAVHLTQAGLGTYFTNLSENCKIDSRVLQHYYVNVRAVNVDTVDEVINESLCDFSTGCKFEIITSLDSPCEYEEVVLETGEAKWQCKR